jgi:hypothetical protein
LQNNSKESVFPWIILVEFGISEAVIDSSNEVRDLSRQIFEEYKVMYPERLSKYIEIDKDLLRD